MVKSINRHYFGQSMRQMSPLDTLITNVDLALQTLLPPANRHATRQTPAHQSPPATDDDCSLDGKQGTASKALPLTDTERRHVAGLFRVNHAGEVCAQALYQGQALTAKLPHVKAEMQQAADEETDHLAWCEARLKALNSRPSLLNPFWYANSLLIGALAGLAGDKWSLGFVVETERQVAAHLEDHIAQLPESDKQSRAILEQMAIDESVHAATALDAGGAELPVVVKIAMGYTSKVLTTLAYYI